MATHDDLRKAVTDAFGFFSGKSPRATTGGPVETLTFVGEKLFLDVEIDEREQSIFVLCGPLRPDGSVPDGYYVDSSGRQVRWHLAQVLDSLGKRDVSSRLRAATGRSGAEAMVTQIARAAEALEVNLTALEGFLWHGEFGTDDR